MPIIGSRAVAGIRSFGLYVLAALSSVIDTFNRSDSASELGSAGGQKWKIWRGVWGISSNKASSSTSASTYPLATLSFTDSDVNIGIGGPSPGTGTGFWLSDGDNWWAAVYDEVYSCQTCSNSTCNGNSCSSSTCTGGFNCAQFCCSSWSRPCNSGNCSSYICQTYSTVCNANSCNSNKCMVINQPCNRWGTGGKCNGYTQVCNKWQCNGWACNNWSRPCNAGLCSSYSCTAWGGSQCNASFCCVTGNCNSYTCNAYSCTTYVTAYFSCNCVTEKKINVIKSISGTISTVAGSIFSGTIQSFKAILFGNNVTIQAYSLNDYTSQIGSDFIIDATGASKSKKHGIIISPATNNQGNTIDGFRVD